MEFELGATEIDAVRAWTFVDMIWDQMHEPDDLSRLRHGMRGLLNAISLGVCALEIGLTKEESVEFLGDIARSAGELSAMLDEYEPIFDAAEIAKQKPQTGDRKTIS